MYCLRNKTWPFLTSTILTADSSPMVCPICVSKNEQKVNSICFNSDKNVPRNHIDVRDETSFQRSDWLHSFVSQWGFFKNRIFLYFHNQKWTVRVRTGQIHLIFTVQLLKVWLILCLWFYASGPDAAGKNLRSQFQLFAVTFWLKHGFKICFLSFTCKNICKNWHYFE